MFLQLFLVFLCSVVDSSFDPTAAKSQLLYSYASYCSANKIKDWSCYWCTQVNTPQIQSIQTINVTSSNTFSYVFHDGQKIWVVVRGTQVDSITNWINNVKFVQTPLWSGSSVKVHEGFKTDTMALYPGILKAVTGLRSSCSGCPIFLTGHSLGGSIASITAMLLRKDISGITVQETTFGSPRTGNSDFEKAFVYNVSESWRVVHANDIVPHVPAHLMGYDHVPTEVWYMPQGGYKTCDGSGEDKTCSDSVSITDYSVNDHLTYFNIDLRTGKNYGC